MQPQSEISKSKPKAKSSSNPQQQQQLPVTAKNSTTASQPKETSTKRSHIKVIKSRKPLCHFKFYLDVCDHQLTKRIEDQIKALGGNIEFFLTPNITHFVTDKTVLPPTVGNNNNTLSSRPGTPQTSVTTPTSAQAPHTPYSVESYDAKSYGNTTTTTIPSAASKQKRQTRADTILSRARRQSTESRIAQQQAATITVKCDPSQQSYIIWNTEVAFRFFKKVENELKHYLESSGQRKLNGKSYGVVPTHLKGSFIKIEATKNNYRPYYHLCKKPIEWPKIELTQEEGAFRFTPKKSPTEILAEDQLKQTMTRKSRSRSSQRQHALPNAVQALKKGETCAKTSTGQHNSNNGACKQAKESTDKQCGVCEICKIEYDTLTIHLKTKDHEYFAKNSENFIALDTLIHASADVNKFLSENKKLDLNAELSEMEVDEDVSGILDERDPIANEESAVDEEHRRKRRTSGSLKTPSPTLRERSKRITKGKHSSEKFQQLVKSSTKTPLKSTALQKKVAANTLEMQRNEETVLNSTAVPTTHPNRKRKSATSVYSPPMRVMLPPSSLYKVVETPDACTPTHKIRDAGEQAVGSPSLIVKFKKVRQAELLRLHGEAESFMFPKRNTSSDLPTDVDRQTTSDNIRVNMSSISLESTSDHIDVDNENSDQSSLRPGPNSISATSTIKKAIAKPTKRRRGAVALLQSFPTTPIQPEVQLKRSRKSATATTTITSAAISTVSSLEPAEVSTPATSISLPEATRKSSRTATAIVTAATTSSRLLRAAVEAAKNSNRRYVGGSIDGIATPPPPSPSTPPADRLLSQGLEKSEKKSARSRNRTVKVVKMEDRMGDRKRSKQNCKLDLMNRMDDNEVNEVDENANDDVKEDDEDEDDEENEDDDDDNDEDYISHSYYKNRRRPVENALVDGKEATLRVRGRRIRKVQNCSVKIEDGEEKKPQLSARKAATKKGKAISNKQQNVVPAKPSKPPPPPAYDYSKSERISKYRYAFERLPVVDIWYKVFARQDECKERYFEYYGSTDYRKLPYELGPIPFDRTVSGGRECCRLCNKTNTEAKDVITAQTDIKIKQEMDACDDAKHEHFSRVSSTNTPNGATTSSSIQYTHKHKKLHLLQRYQQEQQELLQKHQPQPRHGDAEQVDVKPTSDTNVITTAMTKCDSKASSPEREHEHERAGSSHSNASSYASSNATSNTKKQYRNKHLHRAALMNFELPPRKSPREHASTLALVSCIIKQRQDSQSIPNSETDEPPPTPTPMAPVIKEEPKSATPIISNNLIQTTSVLDTASPRTTRSSAPTPIEEMRFTTEISENVKRMRRGQNKYDHSPPVVYSPPRRAARGRTNVSSMGRRLPAKTRPVVYNIKKRRRQKCGVHQTTTLKKYHSYGNSTTTKQNSTAPLIRKTGSKKGVLEFEVDEAALKALDVAMTHTNYRQLEWEIDKYIQLAGKDYDLNLDIDEAMIGAINSPAIETDAAVKIKNKRLENVAAKAKSVATLNMDSNTPPPTDYFSSDFDLYDLIANTDGGTNGDDELIDGKRKNVGICNSVAMHSYFRKRKNLKSNRTGWPKVQKKKTSVRQQQRIRILQGVKLEIDATDNAVLEAANQNEVDGNRRVEIRKNGVMTPPDSDMDGQEDTKATANTGNQRYEAEETEQDAGESIPEEDDIETVGDSIEDEPEVDAGVAFDADGDADADADEEEEEDDDDDDDDENDDDSIRIRTNVNADADVDADVDDDDYNDEHSRKKKRGRRDSDTASPVDKLSNCLHLNTVAATSTPSTQLLRGLRRTPQLNGSLGSCMSPSEKAGDNSDIFTVSSDGLDTDMDISNSQYQHKGDDNHPEHCSNHTPKRKLDITKYVGNKSANNNCDAEAATAAVKSLAISQFLKKEVRVTCRRLRAPFRRFRFRR